MVVNLNKETFNGLALGLFVALYLDLNLSSNEKNILEKVFPFITLNWHKL